MAVCVRHERFSVRRFLDTLSPLSMPVCRGCRAFQAVCSLLCSTILIGSVIVFHLTCESRLVRLASEKQLNLSFFLNHQSLDLLKFKSENCYSKSASSSFLDDEGTGAVDGEVMNSCCTCFSICLVS